MLKQHKRALPSRLVVLTLITLATTSPLAAGFRKWTTQGPDGGSIRAIAVDASSPAIVYAGSTQGGLSRSLDGGVSWETVGSSFSTATIRTIATEAAAPGVVFAGGEGAFRSLDYGESWSPIDPQIGDVESIVIDPSAPLTVYAAGSQGVAKSVDGGDQWSPAQTGLASPVFSIIVDPSNTDILYAGTTAAVYKSVDGGQSWNPSSSGIINAGSVDARAVAMDFSTPTTLVAATASGTYRSIDGAGSWVLTTLHGDVNDVRIDPFAPNIIYAATETGVDVTTNAGSSWTGTGPTNPAILALGVDRSLSGRVWAGTDGGGVRRSDDFGISWTPTSRGLRRCAVNAVAMHPIDPARLYAGADGAGVAQSQDAGDNWSDSSSGITRPSVKALVDHWAFPGVLFAGIDDGINGGVFWTSDGAAHWTQSIGLTERIRNIAIDLGDPVRVLAVGPFSGVAASSDNGLHWGVDRFNGLPSAPGAALAFDPAGNGTVYMATGAGVYKSFDHGHFWEPKGLADQSVRSIAVDPFSPGTLYAGIDSPGPSALQKSETGGLSWAPASNGLVLPIHAIVADPATPDTLYAAGNSGVFMTANGGDSWSPVGDPFEAPNVVTSLAIDSGGNILHAGTSTDGVAEYQLHFFDVPPGNLFRGPVETIAANGISSGCGAGNFCVSNPLTRAQASVWLLRAMHGGDYEPPPATGTVFPDVPSDAFAASWIEQLAAEGVTSGCGAEGFCPGAAVTRAQLAVWLLRGKHGSAYTPPPATGLVFGDVPTDAFAAAWIEQLAAEGISGGCGGGNFCPADATARGQAAALLVKTFELE